MHNNFTPVSSTLKLLTVISLTFCLTVGMDNSLSANTQTSVKITPKYLERLYEENIRIYRLTSSDSATIIFSRATLQRVRDLKKLNAARIDPFVDLIRDHIEQRANALIYQLQQNPLSAGDSRSEVLPRIVEQVSGQISAMASAEGASHKQWQSLGEALRELQVLIEEQLEESSTGISFPWQ